MMLSSATANILQLNEIWRLSIIHENESPAKD